MATKRTYEENLALTKARGAAAKKAVQKAAPAKQLSLELWPDAVRGVPNAILRGSLFGVGKVRKLHQKRTLITTLEGYEIRFKGESFNQTDLDVWEMLLHLARLQPLGTKVEFTAHALLKELGKGTGGKDHEELKEGMARLASGLAEITWTKEQKTFAGTLVSGFFRDEETGRYVVKFNTDMLQLYGMGHTLIDWEDRKALGKNNLAKWLQGFYSSHAKPYPIKVATLRKLCGSDEVLRNFKVRLKAALDELVQVGTIKSWDIKDDLVSVVVVPSKSQLKHLAKR